MLVRRLKRVLWCFGLVMMAVAAVFGIPLILDPPPRDRVVESQDQPGASRKKRKRRAT